MGVGRQFKRIGETAVAYGLWAFIIWIFSNLARLFIFLVILLGLFVWIGSSFNDVGDKFYVQTATLDLLDKPMGKKVRTLQMNDTLIIVKEMSEEWVKVAADKDTLYFKNEYLLGQNLGYSNKIEKTPFNKWKALSGEKATLNHPDGYFDTGNAILKNGERITITKASESDSLIHFRVKDVYNAKIHLKHLLLNWESVLKKYPRIAE